MLVSIKFLMYVYGSGHPTTYNYFTTLKKNEFLLRNRLSNMKCAEVLPESWCLQVCVQTDLERPRNKLSMISKFLSLGWFLLLYLFFFLELLIVYRSLLKSTFTDSLYRVRIFNKYYLMFMCLSIEALGNSFALVN